MRKKSTKKAKKQPAKKAKKSSKKDNAKISKPKVKQGRPKIRPYTPEDWEQFDKLCEIQCTKEEIAKIFGCHEDTIENRVKEEKGMVFSKYYKKVSAGGKASLRRWQFKAAEKGSAPLLIWLGKQHLNQTDKEQVEHLIKPVVVRRTEGEDLILDKQKVKVIEGEIAEEEE